MGDIRSEKRAWRAVIRSALLALTVADRRSQEVELHRGFWELPGLVEARTVLLYASAFPEEVDTWPLLRTAATRGKSLVCPTVDRPARRLRLSVVTHPETDLVTGSYGIAEPAPRCPEIRADQVDWVLVPGLAFDRQGHRLGRGAGYYDRLLAELPGAVPRWALAYTVQVVDRLPVEPHDQPLHGVLTAAGPWSRSG